MNDIWTRLKEANPIEEVVAECGITLNGRGRTMKAVDHDSFVVDVAKQYYVWNAQGRGGSVIDFLVNERGMSLQDAEEWLARRAGIEFHENEHDKKLAAVRRIKRDALTVVHQHLQSTLLGAALPAAAPHTMAQAIAAHEAAGVTLRADALRYAERRGFTLETLRKSGAGFWDGDTQRMADHLRLNEIDPSHPAAVAIYGWRGDVPSWARKWGIDLRNRDNWVANRHVYGMREGMFIYAHMERNEMGYFAGRAINPEVEKRWAHYNPVVELMGDRRPYWNHAIQRGDAFLVVVEGQADAMTLAQWGIPAMALAGLSSDDETLTKLAGYKTVVLALEGDAAGMSGQTAAKLLPTLGPVFRVATWPEGVKDANQWLQDGGTAEQALDAIHGAEVYVVWMAARAMAAPELVREPLVMEVIAMAAQMTPYDMATRLRPIAKVLGMTPTALQRLVKLGQASTTTAEPEPKQAAPTLPPEPSLRKISKELPANVVATLLKQPCDDEGNAQCVLAYFGKRMAYVPQWGWMVWDGKKYDTETGIHQVERMITETLLLRATLAVEHNAMDNIKYLSRNRRNITGALGQLASLTVATTNDFDNQPDHLNVQNGVLDLRTGEIAPHDFNLHRFTYVCPVGYNPKANYDHWLGFLEQVVDSGQSPDQMERGRVQSEMIIYLQMACGYSLSGRTRENCLFYIYGPTRSGKGTFIQTIMDIMGKPLASAIDFQTLMADRNGDTQGFDLAGLVACRFVSASESGKYERLNAEKIKQVTGQDAIRCSFKRKDHFTYTPQFKIWLQSNHPVNIDVYDDAVWGRLHVIEFPHSFLGKEDLQLKEKLSSTESLEGVLAWLVDGAMMWDGASKHGVMGADGKIRYGLPIPTAVREATGRQRASQDYLQMFLEEMCEVADPDNTLDLATPYADVYMAYELWCKDLGITSMKQRAFSLAMTAGKKFKYEKRWMSGKTKQCYLGIRMAPPEQRAGQMSLINHKGGENH